MNTKKKKEFIMYNSELKERFLARYTNEGTRERYLKAFDKTENFEESNKKDLYEFNLIEAMDMLTAFNSKSVDTLRSYRAIFGKYVDFCIRNNCLINGNLLTENIYNGMDNSFLEKLIGNLPKKHRYLKSWDEYEEILDLPNQYQGINYQDIASFPLLISGIKAVNIPFIEISMINKEQKTIEYKNVTYKFNEKEMNIIIEAMKEEQYYSIRERKGTQHEIGFPLENSVYLIKSINVGAKSNVSTQMTTQGLINRRVRNVCKNYLENGSIGSDSIYKSGKFLRLNDLEIKLGRPIVAKDIPTEFKIRYDLSDSNISSLLKNYKMWKEIKD